GRRAQRRDGRIFGGEGAKDRRVERVRTPWAPPLGPLRTVVGIGGRRHRQGEGSRARRLGRLARVALGRRERLGPEEREQARAERGNHRKASLSCWSTSRRASASASSAGSISRSVSSRARASSRRV